METINIKFIENAIIATLVLTLINILIYSTFMIHILCGVFTIGILLISINKALTKLNKTNIARI